jgi:hypothetical protein
MLSVSGGSDAELADHRHRLIAASGNRPRDGGTAEQEQKVAPPIKKLTGHETAATGLSRTEKLSTRFIRRSWGGNQGLELDGKAEIGQALDEASGVRYWGGRSFEGLQVSRTL